MLVTFAGLAAAELLAAIPSSQPVEVSYSGYTILRMRESAWALSPVDRANIITCRFASLVNEGFQAQRRETPLPVPQARTCRGNWVVLAGNTVLVTVTEDDARANNTRAKLLAGLWAKRVEHALKLAVLDVRTAAAGLAVGESWIVERVLSRMGPVAVAPPACGKECHQQPAAQTTLAPAA